MSKKAVYDVFYAKYQGLPIAYKYSSSEGWIMPGLIYKIRIFQDDNIYKIHIVHIKPREGDMIRYQHSIQIYIPYHNLENLKEDWEVQSVYWLDVENGIL